MLHYLQSERVPTPSLLGWYTWNTSTTEKSLLCSLCLKNTALNTYTQSDGNSSDMLCNWQPRGLTLSLQRAVDLRYDTVGMEVLARLWQGCINALVPLEQELLIYVFAIQCRALFQVPAGGVV